MQGVKDTIGSGPFNINELLAMLRLLRYVCSHKDAELARLVKRAHARGQVIVPDSGCCLVPTSACVHAHTCPPQLLARYCPLCACKADAFEEIPDGRMQSPLQCMLPSNIRTGLSSKKGAM